MLALDIGVAGLEKTVVTAASFRKGRWVDVPVKLKVPKAAGGMLDHVESSKVMLHEMGQLYVDHDIQYAAATDGGRQLNDKDAMVQRAQACSMELQ